MDQLIKNALRQDRTIDITTIGRESGIARRIEIWFHNVDDELYISGPPGNRDWFANMLANPDFTFHLKGSRKADLPAKAIRIIDPKDRRQIMSKFDGPRDLDDWVARSPLIKVSFLELDYQNRQDGEF